MKLRLLALPILLASLTACTLFHQPSTARYFQPAADQIGPNFNSYGEAVLPEHGLIVVQGDDLAYGVARHPTRNRINDADVGQASITISQSLRKVLRSGDVRIENRGFPGDTLAQSAERWADAGPGNLLILAYGFGDLRARTPGLAFGDQLRTMIRKAHAHGAAVFVITPPDVTDTLVNSKLATYRFFANAVAEQEGAEVFPASAAMTKAKEPFSKGVPQTARTYEIIAASMVSYIKFVHPEG
ncbi:MAG: SGNH/GDSL hydrolase family protein [Caulobacteraceae bacterium]